MPVPIYFNRGRLQVGWRKCDWTDVWFTLKLKEQGEESETSPNQDEDNREFVFTSDDGNDVWEAPLRGEIFWLPFWDPANCEATDHRTRMVLHKKYLIRAHDFMSEMNPEVIEQMVNELDKPNFVRWQRWFDEAKKEKGRRLRQRRGRKKSRKGGISEEDLEDQMGGKDSDSDDDSAIGDSVPPNETSTGDVISMPPPPWQPTNHGKRRAPSNSVSGAGSRSKRTRTDSAEPTKRTFNGWRVSIAHSSNDGSTAHRTDEHAELGDDTRPRHQTHVFDINLTPPPTNPSNPTNGYPRHYRRDSGERNSLPHRSEDGDGLPSPSREHEFSANLIEQWQHYEHLNGDAVDEHDAFRRAKSASEVPGGNMPTPMDINGAGVSEDEAMRLALLENERVNQQDRPVQSVEGSQNGQPGGNTEDGD